MPGVVLDSTCLIALEKIDRIDLLPGLFTHLFAPPAVAEAFGISLQWLTVIPVSNQLSVTVLRTQLDRGEAEALVLATELPIPSGRSNTPTMASSLLFTRMDCPVTVPRDSSPASRSARVRETMAPDAGAAPAGPPPGTAPACRRLTRR